MDKPISMTVKDFIIRQMGVKMMLTEPTIEAVINHQFQSALQAAAVPSNMSVELSGFGKMYFNPRRAMKKWEKMHSKVQVFTRIANDPAQTEQKRISATNKLNNTLVQIEQLKPKIDELIANMGGMAKPSDSPKGAESPDKQDSQGAPLHMREVHLPLQGEGEEAGV